MDIKELKELIKLYEAVKETNISIQELIQYIDMLENKNSIEY